MGEHWEELCHSGYRFAWEDELFRPGTDTFALSSFPRLRPGARVCDLGCGTGLLSVLLLQREPSLSVTGLELQPEAAALAERCAVVNGWDDTEPDTDNVPDTESVPPRRGRFTVHCMDLRRAPDRFPPGGFDLVVSNPPYFPPRSGRTSPSPSRRQARSEEGCALEELANTAAYLLRWGGAVCLTQKPERLADALGVLRSAGCEPKRLRLVCHRADSAPSLLLLEGRRGGKPGLRVERPLALYRADGSPTEELDRIYFRTPPQGDGGPESGG